MCADIIYISHDGLIVFLILDHICINKDEPHKARAEMICYLMARESFSVNNVQVYFQFPFPSDENITYDCLNNPARTKEFIHWHARYLKKSLNSQLNPTKPRSFGWDWMETQSLLPKYKSPMFVNEQHVKDRLLNYIKQVEEGEKFASNIKISIEEKEETSSGANHQDFVVTLNGKIEAEEIIQLVFVAEGAQGLPLDDDQSVGGKASLFYWYDYIEGTGYKPDKAKDIPFSNPRVMPCAMLNLAILFPRNVDYVKPKRNFIIPDIAMGSPKLDSPAGCTCTYRAMRYFNLFNPHIPLNDEKGEHIKLEAEWKFLKKEKDFVKQISNGIYIDGDVVGSSVATGGEAHVKAENIAHGDIGIGDENKKDDAANETRVKERFDSLAQMARHIWGVAGKIFANPLLDISTVIKKIATKASKERH